MGKNSRFFIIALAVILAVLGIWFVVNRSSRSVPDLPASEATEVPSTGGPGAAVPTIADDQQFRIKVREHLPLSLKQSTVTYDFRQFAFQIDYCGDFNQAITEFKDFLTSKGLDPALLNVEQMISNNLGACI